MYVHFPLVSEPPNGSHKNIFRSICQLAIWESMKTLGKWTPTNGGDKNFRAYISHFARTEILQIKLKSNPIEFQTNFFANRMSGKSFLSPHCGRRYLVPKTKKHGGHKNDVFYATTKTTEVTKMAVPDFLHRLHQVVRHAKIAIFGKGLSEAGFRICAFDFPPSGL